MSRLCNLLLLAAIVFTSIGLSAQWAENPTTGSSPEQLTDRTNLAGMTGLSPELKAGFVQKSENAKQHKIAVRAEVWGVHLVPPDANARQNGTASLSFVLDHNAPVKTDQKEYTFDNVSPGQHTVTVRLLSPEGQEIGSNIVLGIHIPK